MTSTPTVRCPLCGTPTGESRCPVCGSTVDRPDTPSQSASTEPVDQQIQGAAASSIGSLTSLDAVAPATQPLLDLRRPPDDDDARQAATRRGLIGAGLVGAVLIVVAAIQLGGRGDSTDALTQPAGTTVSTEDVAQGPSVAPTEVAQPEETATTTTEELRVPPSGAWILVLESVPKTESDLSDALAMATTLGDQGESVEVIDSDLTPGLNSGYWVVINGDFADRAEAAQACSSVGREVGGECYPRLVG